MSCVTVKLMETLKSFDMQRGSTLYLRLALLALGAAVLALCIFALPSMWAGVPREFPDKTYVFYGILIAMYAAAIPFFIALREALHILQLVDKNKAFSLSSVKALLHISYCGIVIAALFSLVSPLFYSWAQHEDAPGLIVMNLILVGASFTVTVLCAVVGRLLSEAIAIKSENDLTV